MIQQTIYQSPQSQPHLFPPRESTQEGPVNSTMNQSSSKWGKFQNIPYTERTLRFLLKLWGIKYMTTTQICELFWLESSSSPLLARKSCQRSLRQDEKYGL